MTLISTAGRFASSGKPNSDRTLNSLGKLGTLSTVTARVQDPPTEDWPAFPTAHAPTLYALVREQLPEQSVSVEEVETLLEENDIETLLREYEIAPPNLTTRSVRRILGDLCDEAGIDPDGPVDYLQPHGARRGVGDVLYRKRGPAAAQRALRHEDPQTTAKAYQHIDAGDLAEDVSNVFDEADGLG